SRIMSAIAGIFIGNVIWVILCALGIAALIKESEFLFEILKVVGASYLIYLGVKVFRDKASQMTMKYDQISTRISFMRGMLSSLSNPKGFIFYLSFLPQFVYADESYFIQILLLGLAYMLIFIPITLSYGLLGKSILPFLVKDKYIIWINRTIGSILVGSGISLFWYKHE
ncbi:MAG: LysE family translocator, partial [Bacteroidota bacterium]